MSGNHWCPAATASSVAAGVGQLIPSGELRAKIFASPLAVLALQTTWTPVASAATADELKKREKVNPVGHANGPSPQSEKPLPLYWLESNCTIEATTTAGPNVSPPCSTAAENAKSCEPEGPQDLTQRLSHLRLETSSVMRWRREAAALAIESPDACEARRLRSPR
jgi:hypothetical protein